MTGDLLGLLPQSDLSGILVIGQGAREHAILWGISKDAPRVPVYAAPGNAGIEDLAVCVPVSTAVDIARWAENKGRLLVIVGPEDPLAQGVADMLRRQGHVVVGPSRQAARLESSKAFAKEFMNRHHIPTASWRLFHSPEKLRDFVMSGTKWPLVLKQSRLAQGKGVVVAQNRDEALEVVADWNGVDHLFDDGVIAEECLVGREVSVHVLTNGEEYVWLPLAQDYKRLNARPNSPNTGGMGAYAPVNWLKVQERKEIDDEILRPVIRAINEEGMLYRGILYVGLMMTGEGPQVLEFNVRLGDPETEVIIPIMDIPWTAWWWALGQGYLLETALPDPRGAAVAVVMASKGYPRVPVKGQIVEIDPSPGGLIFHAATHREKDRLIAAGGRVLAVVGLGSELEIARKQSYRQIQAISFPQSQYRDDIARDRRDSE